MAYRILRTLGRLKSRHPELELDERLLTDMTEETLAMVFRLTAWRVALQEGVRRDSKRATCVQELIRGLLAHRERLALERLFRLLSLLHPGQDLRQFRRHLGNFGSHRRKRRGPMRFELLRGRRQRERG